MSLSTLRFKYPARLFIGVLVVCFALAVFYAKKLNPELNFWKQAIAAKVEWSHKMRDEKNYVDPLIVFSGGSATCFRIDSGLLFKEFGLRTVNFGLHAGMGLDGTVALATAHLRPGDQLVLTVERKILSEGGGQMTGLGSQLVALTGSRENAFFQSQIKGISSGEIWWACRPGLQHTSTMLGKILLGKSGYRYRAEDLVEGGLATTAIRQTFETSVWPALAYQLTPRSITFLKELRDWTAKRNIKLVYLMPICYVSPSQLIEQRHLNEMFLQSVSEIIPVWRDEYFGASDIAADFSDTDFHMTREAAATHSRYLGKFLLKEMRH